MRLALCAFWASAQSGQIDSMQQSHCQDFLRKGTNDANTNTAIPEFPNSQSAINLTPQKPVLPLEIMSQFAEPVIPDKRCFAGRDPDSSLGDELPRSLLRAEETCSYHSKLNK